MNTTCLRSAARPLLQEARAGFFTSSFGARTTLSCSNARAHQNIKQRSLHTTPCSSLIASTSSKHVSRFAPSITKLSVPSSQHRQETTVAAAPQSDESSATKAESMAMTWNEFFRLRQRRRYINIVSSLITSSSTSIAGFGVVASQDLESLQLFGLDPLVTSGIICLAFAASGWLMGPLLGSVIFRLFVGRTREMRAKEKDFFSRINRYRVSASNSSMQNPLPDYYGEKITSVKGYRQWLKDQRAFRRKRESML